MAHGHTETPNFLIAAREIVARQQAAFDAAPSVGVCWGGMAPERPRVEALGDVAERLADEHARRQAFLASPRGRFLQAVNGLEEVGAYEVEVYRLRGFYNRTLTALNGPLSAEALPAVAECVAILNGITGADARAAIDALADLLREEGPQLGKAA